MYEDRLALINRRLALLKIKSAGGRKRPASRARRSRARWALRTGQREDGVPAEVLALARAGNAIAAIKLLRDLGPTYAMRKLLSNHCNKIGWLEHQFPSATL